MKLRIAKALIAGAGFLILAASGFGQYRPPNLEAERPATEQPAILKEVGIDQKLGNKLPLNAKFRDENGKEVQLGEYVGDKPVILSRVYYGCPMLCGQILNGLTRSLRAFDMTPGKDFKVVTVSFDPREKPELALEKKTNYLKEYRNPSAKDNWHWLTGDEADIKGVADAVGFRYVWDEKFKQFAHGSAIMIITPDGTVSRYFYGIEYSPKDMRLGLTEASSGKVGGLAEKLLLYCFHYDPTQGKYTMLTLRMIQVGGFLVLAVLGAFMFVMIRRDIKINRLRKLEESGI